MRKLLKVVLLAASLGLVSAASGAPVFQLTGGSNAATAGNDFQWIGGPIRAGAALGVSEAALVTVEYIGKEAGFANTLFRWGALAGGSDVFSTGAGGGITGQTAASPLPPAAAVAPASYLATAGTLLFNFFVSATGATVENGQGLAAASDSLAFWAAAGSEGTTMYVLLDDGGGSPDADYDDMIVRLTLRAAPAEMLATPEPGTLLLVLAGVGMLVLITRRRMRI